MPPSLNIAALSRRTGVAPDTLRKWEQRYGVLRPDRTPGGQRRYSERDVARVEWLRDRLRDGYRIGEAARILGGIGSAAPAADTDALPGEIVEAVAASDRERIDSLLDQAFGVLPIERVVLDVVAPLLERVGERWSDGTIGDRAGASALGPPAGTARGAVGGRRRRRPRHGGARRAGPASCTTSAC